MFKTILLAYDGSDHAKRAAEVAKAEALAHGARLLVVHVYEPVPDYLGEPFFQEALKRRLERAEKVLVEAVGRGPHGSAPGRCPSPRGPARGGHPGSGHRGAG